MIIMLWIFLQGGEPPKETPMIHKETQYMDQDIMVVKEEENDNYSYPCMSLKRPIDREQDESSPAKRGFDLGLDSSNSHSQFSWSMLQYQ